MTGTSGENRPSKVSDEDIAAAAGRAENMRQLLQFLGLAVYGGNYEVMRRRLTAASRLQRLLPRRA